MTARMSVITDWRVRDENTLPDLAPGEEYERVIAPQKFIVLHRIFVRGPSLVSLRIGAISDVPFDLEGVDGKTRRYRPKNLLDEPIQKQLIETGARAVSPNAIAIAPGLEVRLLLRNEGQEPVKPRAAIVVQEEA